jgi:XTP/dITP diphosphohydrolase
LAQLLLATNNAGKLSELQELLAGVPFELISPAQIGLKLDVAETGRTYAANARLKALAFATASGLMTLADDSGLEVEALGGAPGLYSARYAGDGATDEQRVAYLLSKMRGVPPDKRGARFRCIMALAWPSDEVKLRSGSCRGFITKEPIGINGFGYDPVFYFPKLGKTMAELTAEVKNSISHRARAARRVKTLLQKLSGVE